MGFFDRDLFDFNGDGKTDGFETVDGLHFSTQTYLKIHDFVFLSGVCDLQYLIYYIRCMPDLQ